MAAYVIVDLEITDPELYEEYRLVVPTSIEKYGGKYIVRGGNSETLEGNWQPKRVVVLEFESYEQAKRWYESPEYAEQMAIRHRSAITNLIILNGV
jgi:uncharacterized protein (DUF1330 family)